MYYVDQEQIEKRLNEIQSLVKGVAQIKAKWDDSIIVHLAQERVLQLSIEIVTDVGSLLIDGFIMRDASSYEDIMDIIAQEGVVDSDLHKALVALVQLRKPIVQHYAEWERTRIHPLLQELPDVLTTFAESVRHFIVKELQLP
ncbi:DUF86 domain-containing protein [Paenibacillus sp. 1001270B_150601_E10]|uniref:DUF86 domain-containing protein n=1 Tax=Paenibacillus sp. 1001270B_150601_E10 TaxID=2787079 RepID=UPI00189F8C39|nr:HepT-like ribonuclease domain-containing protein [Paenibacillus sp. 1001270B_150601_E10]